MNSVFSAFKSNKNGPTVLSPTASESNKRNGASKKTLNLNETNNYEKLRHIREKMSNLVLDDDEINLRKPPPIPTVDECDTVQKLGSGFDCVDSAAPSNGYANGNLSSSSSSSSLNTISLASIKKHYNQDNSENYASENNLCCNGSATMGSASNVSIVDTSDVNSSASATNLVSINSMPLSDANDASKSASNICNQQPMPTTNNPSLSNTNRNRPRLSLSNVGNGTQQQPAVHGRNNANGLPTGRTRLSTHQRNLSLDFR
jgi:hypothetical protein